MGRGEGRRGRRGSVLCGDGGGESGGKGSRGRVLLGLCVVVVEARRDGVWGFEVEVRIGGYCGGERVWMGSRGKWREG